MLAGLLQAALQDCRIVLVGDDNQLPPVGVGHVLRDLAALPVPCVRLKRNHRQIQTAGALHHNITRFENIRSLSALAFDKSFLFRSGANCLDNLTQNAANLYQNGASVQVIAPRNNDVNLLNRRIQSLLNPHNKSKHFLVHGETVFIDGDRVMITRNDPIRECWNGENGVIHITPNGFYIERNDGRKAYWDVAEIDNGLDEIALGYSITAHKAQGSEYASALRSPSARGSQLVAYVQQLFDKRALGPAVQKPILFGQSVKEIRILPLRLAPISDSGSNRSA